MTRSLTIGREKLKCAWVTLSWLREFHVSAVKLRNLNNMWKSQTFIKNKKLTTVYDCTQSYRKSEKENILNCGQSNPCDTNCVWMNSNGAFTFHADNIEVRIDWKQDGAVAFSGRCVRGLLGALRGSRP